jgi:hypothetical protein
MKGEGIPAAGSGEGLANIIAVHNISAGRVVGSGRKT